MANNNAVLESLTPEQEQLCDDVAAEYIADIVVSRDPDMIAINKWLDIVYGMYDLKRPARVEIADSPFAALKLASELTGSQQSGVDYCGVSDAGWVSFYQYFARIGVLTADESTDLLALRDFMRSAWDTVLLDECAIVIRRPVALRLDDAGNVHGAGKSAIEWADGEKDFAWHGTWVPERIVMDPRSHTLEEYAAITNTEHRRALGESAGWAWVANLLGAKSISTWTDRKTKLSYHLLRCSDGSMLLKKKSPPLKSGEQPTYFEPVHEDLRTARAARKWQAIPALSVAECESDPDLSYAVES